MIQNIEFISSFTLIKMNDVLILIPNSDHWSFKNTVNSLKQRYFNYAIVDNIDDYLTDLPDDQIVCIINKPQVFSHYPL